MKRCDAITKKGTRCQCSAPWTIPCTIVYDARCNSYRADKHKDVCLCDRHHSAEYKAVRAGERIKLHHGGWLGAFNPQGYGSVVDSRRKIKWKKFTGFRVPKFWSNPKLTDAKRSV